MGAENRANICCKEGVFTCQAPGYLFYPLLPSLYQEGFLLSEVLDSSVKLHQAEEVYRTEFPTYQAATRLL